MVGEEEIEVGPHPRRPHRMVEPGQARVQVGEQVVVLQPRDLQPRREPPAELLGLGLERRVDGAPRGLRRRQAGAWEG